MGPRRPLLVLAALLTLGCSTAQDAAASASWTRVQETSGPERIEAAHQLAREMTPAVAARVLDARGAFAGDDAEGWLVAGAARLREDGVAWLARQVYGDTLDAAFAEVPGGAPLDATAGFGALPDILLELFEGEPLADRWLVLLAIADCETSAALLEKLRDAPPVRARMLAAFDRFDPEKALPLSVFQALGRPSNPAEAAWLERHYARLFAEALDGANIDDQSRFDEVVTPYREAFEDAPLPISAEDRVIVEALPELSAASEEPPEDMPSFDDVARFMTRHRRLNWRGMVQLYAHWNLLPSNALAYVCRASADECTEVLDLPEIQAIAAAADVAPALDLEGGDVTMSGACDLLPPAEARQLAARAIGGGMPLAVRESGISCLAILGDDVTPHWRRLLLEATATNDWRMAEHLASLEPELVDAGVEQSALSAVRSGQVPALEIPGLLQRSDEGRRALTEAVLAADPQALAPDAAGRAPSLLSAALKARVDRGGHGRGVVVDEIIF